MIGSRKNKRA